MLRETPAVRAFAGKLALAFGKLEPVGHRYSVAMQNHPSRLASRRRGGHCGSLAERATGFDGALLLLAMATRLPPPEAVREAGALFSLPFAGWGDRLAEDSITVVGASDLPSPSICFGDFLGRIIEGIRRGIAQEPGIILKEVVFGVIGGTRVGRVAIYHWLGERWVIETALFFDASLPVAARPIVAAHSDTLPAEALEIAAALLGPVSVDSGGGGDEASEIIERDEAVAEVPLAAASDAGDESMRLLQ